MQREYPSYHLGGVAFNIKIVIFEVTCVFCNVVRYGHHTSHTMCPDFRGIIVGRKPVPTD